MSKEAYQNFKFSSLKLLHKIENNLFCIQDPISKLIYCEK